MKLTEEEKEYIIEYEKRFHILTEDEKEYVIKIKRENNISETKKALEKFFDKNNGKERRWLKIKIKGELMDNILTLEEIERLLEEPVKIKIPIEKLSSTEIVLDSVEQKQTKAQKKLTNQEIDKSLSEQTDVLSKKDMDKLLKSLPSS